MSVTLIHGVNDFAAQEFYQDKISMFLRNNSRDSLHIFDGESTSADELEQALNSQSLFGSGNELILIKRLGSNTELKNKLEISIPNLTEDTELIIYEPQIDKRSKLYKQLKKTKSTVDFANLTEYELNNWIVQTVDILGGNIELGVAKQLADYCKGDQLRVKNEIDKLISYDKHITKESVELLVEKLPDDNIFELINYIAANNKTSALAKFDELMKAQVEPHYVLVMICWQLSNMLSIKAAENISDSEIARSLGINPYVVNRTKQAIRNLDQAKLKSMSSKALKADKITKTTSVDVVQSVRQLIAEL